MDDDINKKVTVCFKDGSIQIFRYYRVDIRPNLLILTKNNGDCCVIYESEIRYYSIDKI